jgi:hypothetical protein
MNEHAGLSLRAYARHREALGLSGGTEGAVRKAVKTLRITPGPDGRIFPDTADAQWAARTMIMPRMVVAPGREQRLIATLRAKARGLGFPPAEVARLESVLFDALYRTGTSSEED